MRGIRAVAPGRPLNAIGRVIEAYAKRFGYGVVRDFTGHGIGTTFHSGLVVPHYDDPSTAVTMEAGMTFTIEPMLTLGVINNLLNLVGVKSFYQDIVKGAVIILAVLLVATKREKK